MTGRDLWRSLYSRSSNSAFRIASIAYFGVIAIQANAQVPVSLYGSDAKQEIEAVAELTPIVPVSAFRGTQFQNNNNRGLSISCDELGGCDSEICDQLGSTRMASLWEVRADSLFLHRQRPSSQVFAFNTADPTESLNADDLRLGIHTGFDLSLTRRLGTKTAVELRYFGFDHWDANLSTPTTAGDLLQINAAQPIFTLAGDAITADYQSGLHNAEIGIVRDITENFSLLTGFRYLELDEKALESLVNPGIPFDYHVSTRNRMSGFQMGSKLNLWDQGGYFSIGAIGKAGIYGNSAAQSSRIDTGVVTLTSNGRGTSTAFVGELGVVGKLCLTERLSLRGGYNTLWLTDLALASDQLAVSNFTDETGFDSGSGLFYHGAIAGLEFNW